MVRNPMKDAMRLACVCTGFVFIVLFVGCERDVPRKQKAIETTFDACERATRKAGAAIAADSFSLKQYPPLPSPPGHKEYLLLLEERCNCKYEAISKLPEEMDEMVFKRELECWNDTMMAEIKNRYGEHIFSELREEADKRWRTTVNAQPTSK